MNAMSEAQVLDARGLVCPEPLRLAQERMASLEAGDPLRVLATDPAAHIDFEAWCLRRGHRLVHCKATEDGWDIGLCKGAE